MRFKAIAQNPLEWIALKLGLVPLPLAYSHFGFIMSKVVLEATDKGVFEAIGHNKVSVAEIATTCSLNEDALKTILGVLASMRLVKKQGNLFSLTKQSKKWLLKDAPQSMYWLMMFDNRVCFKWMDHTAEFLQTGKGLQYHNTLTEEEWFYYQKAMEAAASATSKEAVKKIPLQKGAAKMLDIGGSHGLYCLEFCNHYPSLSATIIDLPEAVEKSKPILDSRKQNADIKYIAANALAYDFGTEEYDLVLMASVAHHFTREENLLVAQKVYKALKPGGYFSIIEILRPADIKLASDMLSSIGNFFFALSSTSGTWSLQQIQQWQNMACFLPNRTAGFLSIPGYTAVTAKKPG